MKASISFWFMTKQSASRHIFDDCIVRNRFDSTVYAMWQIAHKGCIEFCLQVSMPIARGCQSEAWFEKCENDH